MTLATFLVACHNANYKGCLASTARARVGDSRAEILAHFGHYRHFPHFVNMSHHGGLGLMEGKPNFHGSMSNSIAGDDSPKTRILPLLPNETCNILSYC